MLHVKYCLSIARQRNNSATLATSPILVEQAISKSSQLRQEIEPQMKIKIEAKQPNVRVGDAELQQQFEYLQNIHLLHRLQGRNQDWSDILWWIQTKQRAQNGSNRGRREGQSSEERNYCQPSVWRIIPTRISLIDGDEGIRPNARLIAAIRLQANTYSSTCIR